MSETRVRINITVPTYYFIFVVDRADSPSPSPSDVVVRRCIPSLLRYSVAPLSALLLEEGGIAPVIS